MLYATLEGLTLPPQFSYKPYIPPKRVNTIRTANAVLVQYTSPNIIIHGDGIIAFSIQGAYPSEFQSLYNLYATSTLTLYTFTGYWGESLEVYFNVLDNPTVRAGLFDVTGQFQVMCETTPISASCLS